MPAMIRRLNYVGQNGTMRPLLISLPLVPALVDNARYFRLEDRPVVPGSGFHISKPSLKSMVRYAHACDAAEQLGEQLRKRLAAPVTAP